MQSVYGSDVSETCDTEKGKRDGTMLHTGGLMYAVSNCGIIYQAREL